MEDSIADGGNQGPYWGLVMRHANHSEGADKIDLMRVSALATQLAELEAEAEAGRRGDSQWEYQGALAVLDSDGAFLEQWASWGLD